MRKIILDVDTGTDDAMAIITAALASDIDLAAVTVTHGNLPLPQTVENTLRVVELLGGNIPVYAGCPEPMTQKMLPGRVMNPRKQVQVIDDDGHPSGLHKEMHLPKAKIEPQEKHAVSYLVDTLRKERMTVVAVGPCTNVGMALRMDPHIAENIEELVIMGGGIRRTNATQAAEVNFYLDPEAAAIVLAANTKITILPLDATTSALFSAEDGRDFISLGNPAAKFFGELMVEFVENMHKTGISNTEDPNQHNCAIHDALCILYLIDPNIVLDIRQESAFVDFSGGPADGMLIVDPRSYFEKKGNVHIAYKIDKTRVKNLLMKILA